MTATTTLGSVDDAGGDEQCTQQVARMVHPESGDKVLATDGCEIDALRRKGYVRAGNRYELRDLPPPDEDASEPGRDPCRQVVAQMVDPETGERVTATDGCQIRMLENRGWVKVSGDESGGAQAGGPALIVGALAAAGLLYSYS